MISVNELYIKEGWFGPSLEKVFITLLTKNDLPSFPEVNYIVTGLVDNKNSAAAVLLDQDNKVFGIIGIYFGDKIINMLFLYLKDYGSEFFDSFIGPVFNGLFDVLINKKIITKSKLDNSRIGLSFGYVDKFHRGISSITVDYLKNTEPTDII